MVRSYVKIYGPPFIKAVKALEAVAIEMSKTKDVKFSHKCIPYPTRMQSDRNDWDQYIKNMQKLYVDCYEPVRLISDSHQLLGEYDFFCEWTENPKMAQIEGLLENIDKALVGLNCNYTLTTK